jgi:molybdate transport system substrate-binding protein
MKRRNFLLSFIAAAAISAGAAIPAIAGDLVIFAAASMKGSLDKVATAFEAGGGSKVAISYASSSQLAKQIEAAAPADVFISADTKWMDYLVEKGAVKKSAAINLLGNRLVLVAASDSTLELKIEKGFPLAATLGDDRIAMGDPKSVPAGKYGQESLTFYGVWKDVEPKVAGADNVRAALKLVSSGEAPLGIVYETDAKADKAVKVVGVFGEESHAPIVYPVAPVEASTNAEKDSFVKFLGGPEATKIFRDAGFTTLAGS